MVQNSTSTTIRIPNSIYEKIEFEATTKDSNISTIINNILRKYVTWDRFVGDIGFMYMQKPFLRAVFEKISEKDITNLAKTIGHSRTRDAVLFINGKVDEKGIVDVVELWLSASKIPVRITDGDDSITFIVQHNLGKKWSLYFAGIVKTLFADLNILSKKEELEEHTVSITFSLIKKNKKKRK